MLSTYLIRSTNHGAVRRKIYLHYKLDDNDFPSDSREKRGHFIGISESVGHAMTFKILTDDTLKVIH
jgi:hypothetical protein